MKTLEQHLAQYAAYHRDRRNIISHFIGIPLIVLAVAIVLSRPGFEWAGLWFSPALVVACVASLFYLRLDVALGVLMTLLLGLCVYTGAALAQQSTAQWLSWGLGLFVVGWVIQFVGHYFEGRKPAFVDDIMGLAVGPLFVVAEAAFLLGLRKDLERSVVASAGPTCIRKA
ncbi:MAG: Mpo1-like protein [Pseudomonas marincola]|uniref:Mpo1 family 2-hydroxy fatty acid dioxygenase n=1 Tax=Pseudomonas marincola TaxID=437900 RepID=UPI0030014A42